MAAAAAATLFINHSFSIPRGWMGRSRLGTKSNRGGVRAFFINPIEDPIVKEALKWKVIPAKSLHHWRRLPSKPNQNEPAAFMGGVFAGFLRLDLNEDSLKEWLQRTVEAAGITEEEIRDKGSKPDEDAPQQIEIE